MLTLGIRDSVTLIQRIGWSVLGVNDTIKFPRTRQISWKIHRVTEREIDREKLAKRLAWTFIYITGYIKAKRVHDPFDMDILISNEAVQ